MRLDLFLTTKELIKSRTRAKDLILEGNVLVNNEVVKKPSFEVSELDDVSIKEDFKYVSRGGYKLECALDKFNISLADKIVVDIGSSTGGFTDCALKNNAKLVYSIDVGSNQLDESLRGNKKIILMEETNFLSVEGFKDIIDYFVMDVSFVSIKNILPHIKELNGKNIITLIKPQFEVGYKGTKTGIIKDKKQHILILNDVLGFIRNLGYNVTNLTYSPIKGKSGNIEYLCYIGEKDKSFDIKKIVEEAHKSL